MPKNSFVLHPAQQDIYVDQLIHPDSPRYIVTGYLILNGAFSMEAFKKALHIVNSGHDIFAMSFDLADQQPIGYVADKTNPGTLGYQDYRQQKDPEESARQWIQEQGNIPFRLQEGSKLFEHCLIRISEECYWYYFRFHHLLIDGIGYQVWLNAIAEKYRQVVAGDIPDTTYPSYATEIADMLPFYSSDEYQRQLQYWTRKLKNRPAKLFTFKYNNAETGGKTSGLFSYALTEAERSSLDKLLFPGMTLQKLTVAALIIYLARVKGQSELLIGIVRHKRKNVEQRSVVGMFSGIVPFIGSYDPDMRLTDFLDHISKSQKEDYNNQHVTLNDLGTLLKDTSSDDNLFEIVVNHLMLDLDLDFGAGVSNTFHQCWNEYEKRPLRVYWQDYGRHQPLQLKVIYHTAYFLPGEAALFPARLMYILEQFHGNMNNPLSSIDILPPAERRSLLASAGDMIPHDPEATIVGRIWQQAERTPDNTAISCNGLHLTYRELLGRSAHLAEYLRSRGVGRGALVPVCLERSPDMIIALLAVLQAAGAYVPIDPAYPRERIRFMIEDTSASLVLTSRECLPLVTPVFDGEIILLDDEVPPVGRNVPVTQTSTSGAYGPGADDAAYIIYTSGSTGTPKGVIIEHKNVISLFDQTRDIYGFHAGDVWTMFHSYCFDFSVWEMYGALLYGGRLVIVPKHMARDTPAFAALLIAERVTVLNQTPAAFYVLQEYMTDNPVMSSTPLRYVIFGGEALNPMLLRPWKKMHPACRLINMYGITETTVHVTFQEIKDDLLDSSGSMIGRPIPSLGVFILDNDHALLPIGAPGEMYIAGAGLARGYLKRDDLTSARFIPNPFSKGNDNRLYKTGDLARWHPGGVLEYLGRIDNQVKIRGYRIELGEIESALLQSEHVKQAFVIATSDKEGNAGEQQLVAYIVVTQPVDHDSILWSLRSRLPEYMIPASIIQLEKMPLTANGKIDRAALPARERQVRVNVEKKWPVNETQSRIAAIWEEILGVKDPGIDDNFFDLGGDSIRLIRIVSRMRKIFGKEIQVADIYRKATIAALEALIGEMENSSEIKETYQQILESLTSQQQTLLAQLPDAHLVEDIFPMSAVQQGMIFISAREPEQAIYHDQFTYWLPEDTDISLFEKALSLITEKHGILRTAFRPDWHPAGMQIVYRSVPVHIEVIDNRHIDDQFAPEHIRSWLREERKTPFDCTVAPLWRASVLTFSTRSVFILQTHHAILDGWSVSALNTELNNCYLRLRDADAPVRLPALQGSYKDYVIEGIAESNHLLSRTFWQGEMHGYKPLDIFSTEKMLQRYIHKYDPAIFEAIKTRARNENIPMKSLFLGALYYTVSLFTYEEELTIGLVTNNRPIVEDGDRILGCFLNTIPFRFPVPSPGTRWKEFIRQIDQKQLELKTYERLPLAEIATVNKEVRDNGNPFFDILFNFINFHVYDQLEKGLLHGSVDDDNSITYGNFATTNTYLDCSINITGNTLSILFSQSRTFKSGKTIEIFHQYFERALTQIIYNFHEEIDRSMILTSGDQLVVPSVPISYPADKTISTLFEEQVRLVPESIALQAGNAVISYKELDRLANQLASQLVIKGIRKEQLIPVCMHRSPELIIAILGILKAGGAYVPLDPTYPMQRIERMLEELAPALIVTSTFAHPLLKELSPQSALINIDDIQELPETVAGKEMLTGNDPDSLAYLMYTSGSTGQPKGVMITQRGVVSLVKEGNFVTLGPSDRLLATGSPSFDATTFEYFGMLLNGGRLVLCQEDDLLDTDMLRLTIRNNGITLMWFTASWLNQLIENDITIFNGLRAVIAGGEKLSVTHIQKLRSAYPDLEIINGYGPTENTTFSLTHRIKQVPDGNIPIGRPLAGRSAFILNAHRQNMPVGVTGELYVGGDGLSRGYYQRADLTAERFVNEAGLATGRVYRTGDLARYLSDGTIEFMSRADQQLKIRGFRVEPGEIEEVILRSGLARQAVVIARQTDRKFLQLIAYVVLPVGSNEITALKEYLAASLPSYMIPGIIHPMASLPLTANGKIDRKGLPDPDPQAATGNGYEAPQNGLEKALEAIWQQLLQLPAISRKDDFFLLGGHSLLLMQLRAHIKKEFGITISVSDLYRHRTLEKLALFLAGKAPENSLMEDIIPFDRQAVPAIPLSFGQEELWQIDKQYGSVHYHINRVYKVTGDCNRDALAAAFAGIIRRHEALRTIIQTDQSEGTRYQSFLTGDDWELHQLDHSTADHSDASLDDLIMSLVNTPFDLSRHYMLRASLVRLDNEEHLLVIVLHHIAADGWSLSIIMKEFMEMYNAFVAGGSGHQPPLALQFADYALWQHRYIASGMLEKGLLYWKEKLHGYRPWLLPSDNRENSYTITRGAMLYFRLDMELVQSLRHFSQREDCTLFMTLLAAFKVAIYRYSGKHDICIATAMAGRNRHEQKGLVGFFSNNLLPLRSDLRGNPDFIQLLHQVRKVILEAYEHQDVPLEMMLDNFQYPPDQEQLPLFQAIFLFQNMPDVPKLDLEGLSVSEISIRHETSQFELNIAAREYHDGLRLAVEYNTDIFQQEMIHDLFEQYMVILRGIIQSPYDRI
ncbi:amino acid adenylation domain-containing protein [Chitinophaga sp. Mgbs1]|uniref:Amino acid adenylation domain-containing protein n=1 Tax=Chitinophaga solisilvae TaxID=1233460 RepID=A0A3S1CVY8_9BACT|nr:amino acid adenylation domain-containing protein [Chitinophaga solisilvae]